VFMPWELGNLMDPALMAEGLRRLDPIRHLAAPLRAGPRTPFGKVATLEAVHYLRNQLLRDTDWASMAHSLEVRVPLVDATLLRVAAPAVLTAPQAGKRILAASPRVPLPDAVIARAKTGFATPINDWLQRDDRLQGWRRVPQLTVPKCPW